MGYREASAHFLLGRDGIAYQLVPTEYIAWHGGRVNNWAVGIEVDSICQLHKHGSEMWSDYGKDVYCKEDEKDTAYIEKPWPGRESMKYWATWPEEQYVGCGRLIKAICHKHQIPRIILPQPQRYVPSE